MMENQEFPADFVSTCFTVQISGGDIPCFYSTIFQSNIPTQTNCCPSLIRQVVN